VRIRAMDLFRTFAVGVVVLFALAMSGTSALACNERQESHSAAQASLTLSSPDQSGATIGAAEVDTIDRLADATTNARARSSDHSRHCPCGACSHCPAAGSAVAPSLMSVDLHSARGRLWMPLRALPSGLPKSPDERPPRQI